jgi:hypothetical protein
MGPASLQLGDRQPKVEKFFNILKIPSTRYKIPGPDRINALSIARHSSFFMHQNLSNLHFHSGDILDNNQRFL